MVKAKSPEDADRFAKRKHRALAVAGVIDGLLDGPLQNGAAQAGLLRHLQRRWRSLCPLLGAQTWPLGLSAAGVLRVAAQSSSVANELKYTAPTLIDAANLLAGYQAVSKVTTVVQQLPSADQKTTNVPPPAPAAGAVAQAVTLCKGVADNDLRTALSRLGAWVLNTQEKKR